MIVRTWMLLLALMAGGLLGGCQQEDVPPPGTEAYRSAVSAFYVGVAAIEVGENFRAEAQLQEVTKLAPDEPAAWADLGVLMLRQQRYERAAEYLEQARALAPDNGDVLFLLGLLAHEQGQLQPAADHLRRAVAADSAHQRARFALARVLEQQGTDASTDAALRLLDRLQQQHPQNLTVLLERARLAAKQGDAAALQQALDALANQSSPWPDDIAAQLQNARSAAEQQALQEATTQIAFLNNALKRLPRYQTDRRVVQPPAGETGVLIRHFLRMKSPSPQPAPPDSALRFAADSLALPPGPWAWAQSLSLAGDDAPPSVMVANGEQVWIQTGGQQSETLSFPGGPANTPPAPHSIAGLDYDYDFNTDLALAGRGGARLFRQVEGNTFADETDSALPAAVRNAPYAGVWAADLDMEGDLDLVLAATEGAPVTLRNDGDGSFSQESLFPGLDRLRQFAWADLDADGDPDAATLDAAGRLQVFTNQRQATPRFLPRAVPGALGAVLAHAAGDVNSDGTIDLVVLETNGTLRRLSIRPDGQWTTTALAQWGALPPGATAEATTLLIGDFDNNGALDVLASAPNAGRLWLGRADDAFNTPPISFQAHALSAADLRGEGRLDLLALSPAGTPVRLTNRGAADYQSKSIRPRAARVRGDRRINPFGIGGEIELRTGLLFQKQVITGPTVHFGLGTKETVDFARIVWPNGTVQAEFDLLSTQTVLARQRLKGSCPWVYTHDGDRMRFVTDFLWRTGLGLQINAQGEPNMHDKAQVIHSEDRIKIKGDELAPRDGTYAIHITGELWETHFFDHVSLVAVDHPADTEVFVDERFVMPPAAPSTHTVGTLHPVVAARDHEGRDVTATIRARDERYLDTFALGSYQGLAEEHFVEIGLGADVPTDGPLWLVADGWVYPTDSSINIALSQGDHPPLRSLQLEVPDGKGGWTVAKANLGFPAGKTKTMLIDLSGVFPPGAPRRVRLRTNMEVYWDRLAWAEGRPDAPVKRHRLDAETAELRYRGFSAVRQKSRRAPEIPIYDSLAATTQIWRDLEGYYTRFGDVRALTRKTDDRYVIMNAGDELVFRFKAPPPPPAGWTRDFVLVGDGWIKDGDYNSGYSRTVRPLPYHGQTDYATPPGRLEDDPTYRRHPEDWETYHTRYVTPRSFHHALVPISRSP